MNVQSPVTGPIVSSVANDNADAANRYQARKATFNNRRIDKTVHQQMARSGLKLDNDNRVVCEGNECGLELRFDESGAPSARSPINVSLGEMKIEHFAQINKMHSESCQYSASQHSSQNTAQPHILYDSTDGNKPIYNLSQSTGRDSTLSEFDNKYSPRESDSISYTQHSKDGVFFDTNTGSLDCFYCSNSLPEVLTVGIENLKAFLANHKKLVSTDPRHPRSADPSSVGAHSSPPPPPAPGQPGVAQSTPGLAQRSREPGIVQPSTTPATHQHRSPQAQTLPAQTPPVPTPQASRQSYQSAVSGPFLGQVVNQNNRESNTPGVNLTWNPKYPQYLKLQTRIDSFSSGSGWPTDKSQTPEDMAKAGFVYFGPEDSTRCFHCDGGLKNWGQGDAPFQEHARHYPECGYLIRNMGPTFISTVQAVEQQCKENAPVNQIPRASDQVPVASNAWKSEPAVKTVMDMGFSEDDIRPAYDIVRSKFGRVVNSTHLLDEIFRLQEEKAYKRHSGEEPAGRETAQAGENDELSQEAVTERNSVSAARAGEQIAAQQHSGDRTPKPEERSSASEGEFSEAETYAELQEENRKLKAEKECKICMEKDINIVLLPCGHLCTCDECAPTLKKCPLCSQRIIGTVKLNFS